MTERKPRGMSFPTWIDQQIADAEKRGVFDDLPGAGKPLNLRPPSADYGAEWVRDYARREGVAAEEFLPTPLKLRREIERLADAVGDMGSEREVRETVGDLNRRILEWRRIPVGPPIHVRLVSAEEMVARWREARAARSARPAPSPEAVTPPPVSLQSQESQPSRPGRARWWRRRGRRA